MRTLLIGGSGTVGRAVRSALEEEGSVIVTQRHEPKKLSTYFDAENDENALPLDGFNSVLYLAGLTSLRACEENRSRSERVNCLAPQRLAEQCGALGTHFVFVSSGAASRYDGLLIPEAVLANVSGAPGASTYGLHKYIAERAILKNPTSAVVRLSKIAGPQWSLIDEWLKKLRDGRVVEAFCDHYLSPVMLEDAASLLTRVLQMRETGPIAISAPDELSYVEVARLLAEKVGQPPHLVTSVSANLLGDPRHFGYSARLNSVRAEHLLGVSVRTTMEVIDRYL